MKVNMPHEADTQKLAHLVPGETFLVADPNSALDGHYGLRIRQTVVTFCGIYGVTLRSGQWLGADTKVLRVDLQAVPVGEAQQ